VFFFAIPYKVNRQFKDFPVLTLAIITTNFLVFAATATDLQRTVQVLGFEPNIRGLYTWFTSMFLHADPIFHLGWNMFFLWLFGSVLEDALGKLRYAIIYFASGLVAALVHGLIVAVFMPQMATVPAIGASGAVAGVMGVFAVRFYKNKVKIAYLVWIILIIKWGVWEVTSAVGLGLWFARELLSGLIQINGAVSGVASWAHIGGFVFGAAVAFVFKLVKEADTEYLTDEAREYAQAGDHELAASRYRQLAGDDPRNAEAHAEMAFAMFMSPEGDKGKAAGEFRKAIELYMTQGRKDDALDAFERLSDIYPELALDGKTLLTMGSLCEGRCGYELALRAYQTVMDRAPDSWEAEKAQFRVAHVYLRMGLATEAAEAWKTFMQRYPSSEWTPFADRSFVSAV